MQYPHEEALKNPAILPRRQNRPKQKQRIKAVMLGCQNRQPKLGGFLQTMLRGLALAIRWLCWQLSSNALRGVGAVEWHPPAGLGF
jgi:hypothetical protein